MDLPRSAAVPIGAHCNESGCGQLDFLPFVCDKCHRIFCLQHHKIKDHSCTYDPTSKNTMPQCPVCQQFVYVKANSNADTVMNEHISSGCRIHLISDHREAQKSSLSAATRCDQPTGCRNVEKYSTVKCQKCGGQFCLTHRLPVTHRCVALPENMKPQSSSSSSASAASSGEKHAAGNALIARLKEKREQKDAAKKAHDATHAQQFPTSSSSTGNSNKNKRAGFLTLQQIRAGINSTVAAIQSVIPGSAPAANSPSSSPPPVGASAPASSSASPPAATGSSSASSTNAAPRSHERVALTPALKRTAKGDSNIPESQRLYVMVDVTAIKSKRAPALCFFSTKHSIGKILDLICDETGIENENHLANGKKIYVCAPRVGATFPTDITLGLLEGALLSGDTITLQRNPIAAQS